MNRFDSEIRNTVKRIKLKKKLDKYISDYLACMSTMGYANSHAMELLKKDFGECFSYLDVEEYDFK